ncbi:MAG: hypothetical protein ACI8PZ_001382 [Myxococcota bacterium]|jgi:hypothetical protein
MLTLLAAAALAAPPALAVTPALPARAPDALWAGTVAVLGERKVPILGTVQFRTDTNALADVWRVDGGWLLSQRTCGVHFARTAGAQLHLAEHAPAAMPLSTIHFVASGDQWLAGPWPSGWNADDHDADGEAGITVNVKAPICGKGELHVESVATSAARGAPTTGVALAGDIKVRVIQTNHSAKGICLRLLPRETDETMIGRFAYRQVALGTTCEQVTTFPDPDPDAAKPVPIEL